MTAQPRPLRRSRRAAPRSSSTRSTRCSGAGFDVPRHFFWKGAPGRVPRGIEDFLEGLEKELGRGRAQDRLAGSRPQVRRRRTLTFKEIPRFRPRWGAEDLGGRLPPRARRRSAPGSSSSRSSFPPPARPPPRRSSRSSTTPAFGPVLVFGLGGLLTEWYGRLAPGATTVILSPGEVKQGLQAAVEKTPALKIFFEGHRGTRRRPSSSTTWRLSSNHFLRIFLSLSPPRTLSGNPTLEELEVNPLLLCANGRWVAADGKARLLPARCAFARRAPFRNLSLLAPGAPPSSARRLPARTRAGSS